MERITYESFLDNIKEIHSLSQKFNDNWQIISDNDEIGGTYLVKSKTIALTHNETLVRSEPNENQEEFSNFIDQYTSETACKSTSNCSRMRLIKFEYHVLYHISYAVPYLCFNAYNSNGTLITLDDAWTIFKDNIPNHQMSTIQLNMLNVLTQMEHPILFKPFLTLHPCRISDVLGQLPHSQNKVLSFLSIYGPNVFLTFDLDYAKHFHQLENKEENLGREKNLK